MTDGKQSLDLYAKMEEQKDICIYYRLDEGTMPK